MTVLTEDLETGKAPWREILPRTPLRADATHTFAIQSQAELAQYVRLNIYPDGGISRLRVLAALT